MSPTQTQDPFGIQITCHNQDALQNLQREIDPHSPSKGEAMEKARILIKRLRIEGKSTIEAEKTSSSTIEYYRSADWTPLEIVTLRRCAMAIIDIDGIGQDVSKSFLDEIKSRDRSRILHASKIFLKKYDSDRGGMDPYVYEIASKSFGTIIFPKEEE